MAVAVVGAISSVLPWILAWFALGGNAEAVRTNIEKFGAAVTKGPISSATNAWIEVAVVAGFLGFGFYILQSKYAKSQGYDVAPPPVESIHVAAPPTFGASGGYSVAGVSGSVSAQPSSGGSRAAGNVTKSKGAPKKSTAKRAAFGS